MLSKEKETEEVWRSIVRLEYLPRRGVGETGKGSGGGTLIRVRRDTAKRARGLGGHGRDTFVRLSPNSIGDE